MPTYCTLADAYGSEWGKQTNNNNNKELSGNTSQAEEKRVAQYQGPMQNSPSTIKQAQKAPQGEIIRVQGSGGPDRAQDNGMNSVCPNCKHCLQQNNEFQQRVVDQSIGPLPRWVPQTDNVQAWDPFTRYFAPRRESFGNVYDPQSLYDSWQNRMPYPFQKREDFGNLSTTNASNLIQLVLYLLITLFVIQLFELISTLNN